MENLKEKENSYTATLFTKGSSNKEHLVDTEAAR